jgi:hypothetical protein
VMLGSGNGPGQGSQDDVLEFGRDRRRGGRWRSRVLLACLLVITGVVVAVRAGSDAARPSHGHVAGPPPVRVISVRHRLLGVKAGWQLFARGPDDLLRIELARGQVTWTYVPPLESASPEVAFVIGARQTVIRSSDFVPAYIVPDGGQARLLTGPLAGSGPMIPGPPGSQAAWVMAGPPTSPVLALVTLSGHRSGPVIRFPAGGPQLPATAVSDGRGGILLTSANTATYDAGPGWDHVVPGPIIAVGPASWLTVACDAQYRHCRYEVVDSASGTRRALPGSVAAEPFYIPWPPTGVIAPDGSTAAVAETRGGETTTVQLINLRTGVVKNLGVRIGLPGSDLPLGSGTDDSMTWSPDSRWLFVAAASGKLVAVNARSDQVQSIGVALPRVEQVAIRA